MTESRFQQAREGLGMSVGQAARFSDGGITREAILEIEGGRAATTIEVQVLARTYRVREEWLQGTPSPDVSTALINARGLERLNEKDLAQVVALMQSRG